VDELIDIFPPPAPTALEPGAALAWPWWLLGLLLCGFVCVGLWRRRLALEAWWLIRNQARGHRDSRAAARQGLRLMDRAFGASPPRDLDATRRRLDACCYGREDPDPGDVTEALARLRPWL
jgi:hypothetical protein